MTVTELADAAARAAAPGSTRRCAPPAGDLHRALVRPAPGRRRPRPTRMRELADELRPGAAAGRRPPDGGTPATRPPTPLRTAAATGLHRPVRRWPPPADRRHGRRPRAGPTRPDRSRFPLPGRHRRRRWQPARRRAARRGASPSNGRPACCPRCSTVDNGPATLFVPAPQLLHPDTLGALARAAGRTSAASWSTRPAGCWTPPPAAGADRTPVGHPGGRTGHRRPALPAARGHPGRGRRRPAPAVRRRTRRTGRTSTAATAAGLVRLPGRAELMVIGASRPVPQRPDRRTGQRGARRRPARRPRPGGLAGPGRPGARPHVRPYRRQRRARLVAHPGGSTEYDGGGTGTGEGEGRPGGPGTSTGDGRTTPRLGRSTTAGRHPLLDAFPPWFWALLVQLALVALLIVLWRARRLGPPVTEPLPVEVRAAETVLGRARLYQRARARGPTAATLRTAALGRLRGRLDLPATLAPARAGRPGRRRGPATTRSRSRELLYGAAPETDAATAGAGPVAGPADPYRGGSPRPSDRRRPPVTRPATTVERPRPARTTPGPPCTGCAPRSAKAVVGQDAVVTGLVIALLCRGHVLLEGVPGVAKTLLVRTLAAALDLDTKRVQFTPDLMPGDVTGSLIFDPRTAAFHLPRGPGLHQPAARRRDQPDAAEDPVGAAGGDGGAPGLGRGPAAGRCRTRSSSPPPRTRSSTRAPTRCPRRSWTGSCSS